MDISAILNKVDAMVAERDNPAATKPITFRLASSYANTIKALAAEKGVQRADIYREIISAFVQQLEADKK
ncbi:hypothetical protein [Hymenobacter sp. CRA2]|uniref:hypothetical protein n=1 Tax=Hymenobacter sp. CRA2 TaxID=1955620 RepID=UPI001116D38A|nr:hypothetical protein [Hymenobacter sp. CRA2]